mmetsp:Transcript_177/g.334  ORF Transcript_177/g.334 Transcript_177/m.334 type:complete len:94 (-) Transcript_177:987-1268(-)
MYLGPVPGTQSFRYHLLVDSVAFLLSTSDKFFAKARHRRVSERTFVVLALLGGGWGLFLSFFLFNHKLRKSKFLAQVVGAVFLRIAVFSLFSR